MENTSITHFSVKKVTRQQVTDSDDLLAIEEPLEIQLMYGGESRVQKSISVTMRTPGNDEELAIGFLFTEGIIKRKSQVAAVSRLLNINKVLVTLHENEQPILHASERNFYTTSSCGICGKSTIEAIRTVSNYANSSDDIQLQAGLFYNLETTLREKQSIFKSTGGGT